MPNNPFFAPNASMIAKLEEAWTRCARPAIRSARASASRRRTCRWACGEPLYDKLDAEIAYAMMGINAVKGVEIGAGFASVAQRGSTHGDEMTPQGFRSNNAGGMLGGISTGQDIIVNIAIKPTELDPHAAPSIDREGKPTMVETYGRHDPCVGIRATPIAEAMLALVLMDHALRHRAQCSDVRVPFGPIPGQVGG